MALLVVGQNFIAKSLERRLRLGKGGGRAHSQVFVGGDAVGGGVELLGQLGRQCLSSGEVSTGEHPLSFGQTSTPGVGSHSEVVAVFFEEGVGAFLDSRVGGLSPAHHRSGLADDLTDVGTDARIRFLWATAWIPPTTSPLVGPASESLKEEATGFEVVFTDAGLVHQALGSQ